MNRAIPNAYGFKWGPADVSRLFEHAGSVTLALTTPKAKLQIRVTPSGQIRINQVAGSKGAVKVEVSND